MGISEEKMKIVINNYFKSECNVNTSIREAFEKGFRIGGEERLGTIYSRYSADGLPNLQIQQR